ncbi:hypothetical protein CWC18_01280 [Pseudoalteromonas aurantia]|nr:hypothetical protein CWC18_01280 [Pseudoalteromonas aurantia]
MLLGAKPKGGSVSKCSLLASNSQPKAQKTVWLPIRAVFKKTVKSRFYKELFKIDGLKMNKKCLSIGWDILVRLNLKNSIHLHTRELF